MGGSSPHIAHLGTGPCILRSRILCPCLVQVTPYTPCGHPAQHNHANHNGTIRSTPLPWLPVLSNITPPHIRRVAFTQRMLQKVKDSPHLPIHADIFNPPTARLPSRRPIWKNTPPADFTTQSAWEKEWERKDVHEQTSGVRPQPTGPWHQPAKDTVVNP